MHAFARAPAATEVPPGACETHSHMYGPREGCPQIPGRTPDLIADVPTSYVSSNAGVPGDDDGAERVRMLSLYGFSD